MDEKLLANTRVKFVGSVTAGADHLDTKWLEKQVLHTVWQQDLMRRRLQTMLLV